VVVPRRVAERDAADGAPEAGGVVGVRHDRRAGAVPQRVRLLGDDARDRAAEAVDGAVGVEHGLVDRAPRLPQGAARDEDAVRLEVP
jgi:hypothetical protein